MTRRWLRTAVFAGLSALSVIAFGDTVLTAHVDVDGTSANRAAALPIAGDYRITIGRSQATVASPNGKLFVLDFDKKSFTSINPAAKTYYQTDIADVLGVGDRVQPGKKVDGSVTFSPNGLEGVPPEVAPTAKPYHVVLQSTLSETGSTPGGVGAGYSSRGGLVLNAGSAGSRSMVVGRRILEGRLWLGAVPAGLDRDRLNSAIECVLLWGAPQMKELAKRVHDSDLSIFGADFSVRVESQREYPGATVPVVTMKITSIATGSLDPATLVPPADYRRATPPAGPLGG